MCNQTIKQKYIKTNLSNDGFSGAKVNEIQVNVNKTFSYLLFKRTLDIFSSTYPTYSEANAITSCNEVIWRWLLTSREVNANKYLVACCTWCCCRSCNLLCKRNQRWNNCDISGFL